jgi:hypothetical protein
MTHNLRHKGFGIPWVGGQNIIGRGIEIPLVWVQYLMGGRQYFISVVID